MKALPPHCTLRRLHTSNESALLEFFRSHTKETVFQRYHYFFAEMSHQRAISLLSVDQQRDVALAIFEKTPDADRIHAIARYYTEPSGTVAEVAFVVRESKRRLGFATRLLQELAKIARANGLIWLRAQVLQDNWPMRGFLAPHAAQIHPMPCADVVEYFLPVTPISVQPVHHAAAPHSLHF